MLVLLLYNAVGYYFVFKYQHQKTEKEFKEYLNSVTFAEEEHTLFKIPVQEYAVKGGSDFSRVEGDFKHDGKFYEIVKQRLENDTVYVYCINNEKEDALYAQLFDHISTHIMDAKSGKSKKSDNSTNNVVKEYLSKSKAALSDIYLWGIAIHLNNSYKNTFVSRHLPVICPPPEDARSNSGKVGKYMRTDHMMV